VAQLVQDICGPGGPISCGTVGAGKLWAVCAYFVWHSWCRADLGRVNLFHVAQLVQGRFGPGGPSSSGTVGAGQALGEPISGGTLGAGPISCGTVGAGQMWATVSTGSVDNHTLVPVVCVCHAMPVCPPYAPVVWFQLWVRH